MRKVTTGFMQAGSIDLTSKSVDITIAMLIKLLATSIVANSRLGCSNSCDAMRALPFSFVLRKLMSFADNEKYAVSAPAVIAVISKSTNIATIRIVALDDANA
jgi:hypothetical protein